MQNKFICEIVGINGNKVCFEFEYNGVCHERLLKKESIKKLRELKLLYPHAVFVVEQKDKDSEIIIRSWNKFEDADIEGIKEYNKIIESLLEYAKEQNNEKNIKEYTEIIEHHNREIKEIEEYRKKVTKGIAT